jgi:hypothetical protein
MSAPVSSIARVPSIARAVGLGLVGPVGRRAGAVAVPLLVAGALAAGCASAQTGAAPGSTANNAAGGHATAPAGPTASATPVPTVSGGKVGPGEPACVGWPSGATSTALPVSFVPVSVERCVNGAQTIPGKGLWTTATLQRSDSDLTGLINALRQPPATHRPGSVCPALAVVLPEVVLIGANGQKLIPRLPATGCGVTQSQVLVALNTLHWQPVSVRLIAKIPGPAAPTVSGRPPHSVHTASGVQPQ